MIEIEVCTRSCDHGLVLKRDEKTGKIVLHFGEVVMEESPKYHAQIKGEPGFWAAGNSAAEAIGDLIQTHHEKFGIKVTHLGKLPR